jgi:hypothetical protein
LELQKIKQPYACQGVAFPMVTYDEMVNISWVKGLATSNDPNSGWAVAEALQQTKFRMNEFGARVESAVAMSFRCMAACAPDPWVVIDRPFILWIERKGIGMPLFCGSFSEDAWSNPGGLD